MLIASEKAKKGIDPFPRLKSINDELLKDFEEHELQMMFTDLRFFFPDPSIYQRLHLFHALDIFAGEHFNIKESYLKRMRIEGETRSIMHRVVKRITRIKDGHHARIDHDERS